MCVLVVVALGALVALVATGAAWPPPLGLLVFALLLALTISRAVLYPSEFAITAESALLLAAVVVFRDSAPFTGPLVLALLVGALDRVHWEQRAFLRMAYNGGGRGVTILAAASTFHLLDDALGGSTAATVLAIVAGAVAVAVFDGLIAVGLTVCRGARPGASVRAIAEIDALDLPLAVAGGLCGLLVVEVGWWAALVPLVALALVPEIVHARSRRVTARVARLRAGGRAARGGRAGRAVVGRARRADRVRARRGRGGRGRGARRRSPRAGAAGARGGRRRGRTGGRSGRRPVRGRVGRRARHRGVVVGEWSSPDGRGDTRGVRRIGARARGGVGGNGRGPQRCPPCSAWVSRPSPDSD